MKQRPVQRFSERLGADRRLSKDEIAQFLDDFQSLAHSDEGKRKLISIRVPERLLECVKVKSKQVGQPYQTQIVQLLREWVKGGF